MRTRRTITEPHRVQIAAKVASSERTPTHSEAETVTPSAREFDAELSWLTARVIAIASNRKVQTRRIKGGVL